MASLAAVLGAAIYQRTGDPWILWGVVGGAGAGCAVLVGFAALVGILTRKQRHRVDRAMAPEKRVPRQQVFMGRK